MREQKKREQSQHLREGSAPRHSSRDCRRRTAEFERFSERNTEEPTCSAQQAQSPHQMLVLGERVALLEKHVACLERELKAIHTKSSTASIAPEKAQQGPCHCCRVCPQTFDSSTQLHRHLRNSKHFSPPPSPASCSEDVRARGRSAAPSSNEDLPYMRLVAAEPPVQRTSSGSVFASVPVATPEVFDAAASEDVIPAGPFSSAVLTAPSSDAPQTEPAPKLCIQLMAATGNDAALGTEPVSLKADKTAKWRKEAENQKALATKWCDRYNTTRELACKIPGYSDPKLAALDAPADLPPEILPLPANADATEWQKKAGDWRLLATVWRSRYNTVNELALKTPNCTETDVPPPQKSSQQAQTYLLSANCFEPKPAIVTAGDLPLVEESVRKGAQTKKSARALGKCVMETSGSPAALKSALVKLGCLAAVSEPVRLPQLQLRLAPLVLDGACITAGIPRPQYEDSDSESVTVMDPISASMGADDSEELDTTAEESVVGPLVAVLGATSVCMKFPENFSATSICPASDTLVKVLAPLRSITAPQHAVHEIPMVTTFSTSAPPNFAVPLARTKPTAAMEHDSFPPLQSHLPSSIPLLGY
jgi:hypothetical protein